jgi:hypothetical protein
MTEPVEQVEQATEVDADIQGPAWGDDAPRGGKAVFSRMTKENSTVPLFFGQTLISSLRDMGYRFAGTEVQLQILLTLMDVAPTLASKKNGARHERGGFSPSCLNARTKPCTRQCAGC